MHFSHVAYLENRLRARYPAPGHAHPPLPPQVEGQARQGERVTAAVIALFFGAYLVGSIPFGVLVGRACKGVDIRQYGSGNIGFSNALRVPGLEAGRGRLPRRRRQGRGPRRRRSGAAACLARPPRRPVAAAPGPHAHPRAQLLRSSCASPAAAPSPPPSACLIGLCWQAALIGLGLWIVVVAITRYISVASILASASVPVYMILSHHSPRLAALLDGHRPPRHPPPPPQHQTPPHRHRNQDRPEGRSAGGRAEVVGAHCMRPNS